MTIVTAGFQGVQRGAPAQSTGNSESTPDTAGLFEELLAALTVSIPFEGGTETTEGESSKGDLDKPQDSGNGKEDETKPTWRTGFGWLQVAAPIDPTPTPVLLIPQALGLAVQSTSASSIESANVTEAKTSADPNPGLRIAEGVEAAKTLDALKTITDVKVDEDTATPPPRQTVAPPLAFELKINTETIPGGEPQVAASAATAADQSQSKTRSEMGSGMALSGTKAVEQNSISAKAEPAPAEETRRRDDDASKSLDTVMRPLEPKHSRSNSESRNNQSGSDTPPHEPNPTGTAKTYSTPTVDASVGSHHERFSSELRHTENTQAQSTATTASVGETKSPTPAQPVTSLRLHLESENSGTPVDLTVKERAGQVRIEVRDANLGRNIELREQLPDLLRRLEEQGFRGEATGGIGHEIAFSASSDANPGSNSDQQQQQQQQQHESGDRRQRSRSDGEDESPSQQNRQDRSKWQSAWFDMANSE